MGARMLRWSFVCGRGLGLHGAEKGVEAREVAEHVIFVGRVCPYRGLCVSNDGRCDVMLRAC